MTKWSRDNILRWILDRDSRGLPVTAKAAREANSYMHRSAITAFGSWTHALSAAGLHIDGGQRRWSGTRILANIRRLGRQPDRLRYSWVYQRRRGLYEAAKVHFGSWRLALLAADIDPQVVQTERRWDRESIIEAILERALKHQPMTKARIPSGLRAAAMSLFGSWPDAITAAGLKPELYLGPVPEGRVAAAAGSRRPGRIVRSDRRRKWTRETIAQALRERVQNNKPVHPSRLKTDVRNLHQAIKHAFGDWASAMAFAGLDPEVYRRDLKGHAQVGASPCPGVGNSVHQVFPSPPDAEVTGGTGVATAIGKVDGPRRPHRRTRWTREAIIAAIQTRAARNLPLKKWKVQPYRLGQVATAVFGSWEEALHAAGVDISCQSPDASPPGQVSPLSPQEETGAAWARAGPPWTREAIMEVIRRRADAGLPLNEAIIRVECGGMYGAAKAKFGSWAETLVAFGLNPNDIRKGPARTDRLPPTK